MMSVSPPEMRGAAPGGRARRGDPGAGWPVRCRGKRRRPDGALRRRSAVSPHIVRCAGSAGRMVAVDKGLLFSITGR